MLVILEATWRSQIEESERSSIQTAAIFKKICGLHSKINFQ